ncbi:GreA/GreB family elongation factor [Spirosoma fluminis]
MTDTEHKVKASLFALCESYVEQRINTAKEAMEAAQESANTEEKSSAGDKYETGRAMAQLERDRHAQLLAEAMKLGQELGRINVDKVYESVQPGSLVITNRGQFFISISAGKLTLNNVLYFAISPASPIGTALTGKKAGDTVTFNNLSYQIAKVL